MYPFDKQAKTDCSMCKCETYIYSYVYSGVQSTHDDNDDANDNTTRTVHHYAGPSAKYYQKCFIFVTTLLCFSHYYSTVHEKQSTLSYLS